MKKRKFFQSIRLLFIFAIVFVSCNESGNNSATNSSDSTRIDSVATETTVMANSDSSIADSSKSISSLTTQAFPTFIIYRVSGNSPVQFLRDRGAKSLRFYYRNSRSMSVNGINSDCSVDDGQCDDEGNLVLTDDRSVQYNNSAISIERPQRLYKQTSFRKKGYRGNFAGLSKL